MYIMSFTKIAAKLQGTQTDVICQWDKLSLSSHWLVVNCAHSLLSYRVFHWGVQISRPNTATDILCIHIKLATTTTTTCNLLVQTYCHVYYTCTNWYSLHCLRLCIAFQYSMHIFFFLFYFLHRKDLQRQLNIVKKWLHEKKICRLSFQILILYSLKKKFLFFFLPKTDLQGLLNIVKNDFIKNRANQVLLGSNIRLRLTNCSRKMSFTKGHIFFYFTLNGEPLQLNKSILNYMRREEDLSNE